MIEVPEKVVSKCGKKSYTFVHTFTQVTGNVLFVYRCDQDEFASIFLDTDEKGELILFDFLSRFSDEYKEAIPAVLAALGEQNVE